MAELNNPGFVPQANPDGQAPGGEPQGEPQATPNPEPQGGEPTPEPEGGEPKAPEGEPKPEPTPDPVPDSTPKDDPVVPEEYKFELGEGVEIDPDFQKEINDTFKSKNFTQEEAQAAMEKIADFGKKVIEKQEDDYKALRSEWVKELKDDKEFGGEKYTETVTKAQAILKQYFDYDTAVYLSAFGIGDNPSMAKGLSRLFDALGEDRTPNSGPGNIGEEKTWAEIMYPEQGKKN